MLLHPIIELITLIRLSFIPHSSYLYINIWIYVCVQCAHVSCFKTQKVNIEWLFAEKDMSNEHWAWAMNVLIKYGKRQWIQKICSIRNLWAKCGKNTHRILFGSIEWKSIDCVSLNWSNVAVVLYAQFHGWNWTTEWEPASTMELNQKMERFFYFKAIYLIVCG